MFILVNYFINLVLYEKKTNNKIIKSNCNNWKVYFTSEPLQIKQNHKISWSIRINKLTGSNSWYFVIGVATKNQNTVDSELRKIMMFLMN